MALCMLLFLLGLSGCNKENPSPEYVDPIFVDLQKRATDSKKTLGEEVKKQAELRLAIEKAPANSIELKNSTRDLEKSQGAALDFEQKALFFEIRAKRRRLVDQITYRDAFAKGLPWPDPKEYSDYRLNIRLQEASRNWSARVPKPPSRLVSIAPKDQKNKDRAGKPAE